MTTPHAKALDRLLSLEGSDDIESAHADADDILTEFLQSLGYLRLVEAYDSIEKWYA